MVSMRVSPAVTLLRKYCSGTCILSPTREKAAKWMTASMGSLENTSSRKARSATLPT